MEQNTAMQRAAHTVDTSGDGSLGGEDILQTEKKLSQLKGIFYDEAARSQTDQDTIVYRVQAFLPVEAGTEGGLFFGTTFLYPGQIGDEYFMTQGHFHKQMNRAEYYWCTRGEGMLLLMDEQRNCRAEMMYPNSLHYIPGFTAHRVVNTGGKTLIFNACWPADAGYNYDEIAQHGFSARVVCREDKPVLVNSNQ